MIQVPGPVSVETRGFSDPGAHSQRVFRAVLDAIARPGRIVALDPLVVAPAPLFATTADILLAMADFETAIWLDARLAVAPEVAAYLRFHTGAKIVTDPAEATFAAISDPSACPVLAAFGQGTADYPDRSTTLIIQSERLATSGRAFEGPGIDGRIAFSAEPAVPGLIAQLVQNRATFPCGVDLVFVTQSAMAALPRSVRLVKD